MLNKLKNIIIIDWDDTLFPTTWVNLKDINLTNRQDYIKYYKYFNKLDIIISNLFIKLNLNKNLLIYIVTNGSKKWIQECYNVLNISKKILVNVNLISARDLYSEKYANNSEMWKKLAFKDIYNSNMNIKSIIKSITSIGDAEYEYNALINLYDNKIILKSVKLILKPNIIILYDQLITLSGAINVILDSKTNLDILFETK
jgi:hypothetical protein